jgi:hypothetical protein
MVTVAAWVDEDTILYDIDEEPASGHPSLVDVGPPVRPLTETLALTGGIGDVPYALSPDRRHLAKLNVHDARGPTVEVGSLPERLTDTPVGQPTVSAEGDTLLWSPDGRRIAYPAEVSGTSGDQGVRTLLVDVTTAGRTRVITGLLPSAWSPDGRLLAGPVCADAGCGLAVADLSSDRVETITSGEDVRLWDLAWSPRGVYLAYSVTGSDLGFEGVALWNRTTGQRHQLMPADEANPLTDLQWTSDGCRLYIAERQDGAPENRPVKAIWGLGPAWEDCWRVAPAPSGTTSALEEDLQNPQTGGPPPCPAPLLPGRRLVAYYGTPLGPGLGILGREDLLTTQARLNEQTRVYQDLVPDVETIPVFHMVTTIADEAAGPDEDYNHRVSHETVGQWIDAAEANGGWAILDVQPGRASLDVELSLIEPLLLEPTVHFAVDPEFMMADGGVPGKLLGHITGLQINQVQAQMDRIARTIGHRKMLVVHQFEDRMVEQKADILDYPFVEVAWDADGFGSPGSKISDYNEYKEETGFEYGGFKLFYDYDDPLMTPEQVVALDPPPSLVIYQ